MLIEIVETVVVSGLITNCYIVADEMTKEAVVIDPGGSPRDILSRLDQLGLKTKLVINTHGHFDHIAANGVLMEATQAPLAAHPDSVPLLQMGGGAAYFGLNMPPSPEPARLLNEGDEVTIGHVRLSVLHTPGHSPGCICLWREEEGVVFDGDVLFNSGIGRSDLPGGNYRQLMESIRDKILVLPDETRVYPGHGPATTVGQERRHNPFLQSKDEWL